MSNETQCSIEMPRYKSHKEVHALKLKDVVLHADGSAALVPAEARYATFAADAEWAKRYHGSDEDFGYYVVYADGYTSWSPTEAFEEGYTRFD